MALFPYNIEEALQDPALVFDSPKEVLEDETLSHELKIKILEQWRYDALLMHTASCENMGGGERSHMDQILKCLRELKKTH